MAEEVQKSERFMRRQERLKQVRDATVPKRVRVIPKDDNVRKSFKGMQGHTSFPATGSVEWPLDQFTKRRLKEGSVLLEERTEGRQSREEQQEPGPVQEAQAAREPEKSESDKRPRRPSNP
jgi:hypothetical protein